jgi:hypothetical protein
MALRIYVSSVLIQTTVVDSNEGTSTMMKIGMDGDDPAALDSPVDRALTAPENHTLLYKIVDEKTVLTPNETFYEAWRLIVRRHASKAAEPLTG